MPFPKSRPHRTLISPIAVLALAAGLTGLESQAREPSKYARSTAVLQWSGQDGRNDSVTVSIAHLSSYPSHIDEDALMTCVYIVGADAVRDGAIPSPGSRRLQHCLRNGRGFRRKEVQRVNRERARARDN